MESKILYEYSPLSFLNRLEMQCFLWFAVLPFFEPQMERFRLVVIFS